MYKILSSFEYKKNPFFFLELNSFWGRWKLIFFLSFRVNVLLVFLSIILACSKFAHTKVLFIILEEIESFSNLKSYKFNFFLFYLLSFLTTIKVFFGNFFYSYLKISSFKTYKKLVEKLVFDLSGDLDDRKRFCGQTINMVSYDMKNIANLFGCFVELVYLFFIIFFSTYFLFDLLGYSAVFSLLGFAFVSFCVKKIAKKFLVSDHKLQLLKDLRAEYSSRLVQLIKMNKYQENFKILQNKQKKIRCKEILLKKKLIYYESISGVLFLFTLLVTSSLALWSYSLSGKSLTTSVSLTVLSIFSMLEKPFKDLADLLSVFWTAKISCIRVVKFFTSSKANDSNKSIVYSQSSYVLLNDFNFLKNKENKFFKKDISLTFCEGDRVAVYGDSGSGKSLILKSIATNKLKFLGEVIIRCSDPSNPCSYLSQNTYLYRDSVENNVFSGENNSKAILESLFLSEDKHGIKAINPSHMLTEYGYNISGGQKKRLCIARALNLESSVYVLDDPLTALDKKTSDQVMKIILESIHEKNILIMSVKDQRYLKYFNLILKLDRSGGWVFQKKQSNIKIKYKNQQHSNKFFKKSIRKEEISLNDLDKEKYSNNLKEDYSFLSIVKSFFNIQKLHTNLMLKIIVFSLFSLIALLSPVFSHIIIATSGSLHSFLHPDHAEANVLIFLFIFFSIVSYSLFNLYLSKYFLWHGHSLFETFFKSIFNTNTKKQNFFSGSLLNKFSNDLEVVERILPFSFHRLLISFARTFGFLVFLFVFSDLSLRCFFSIVFLPFFAFIFVRKNLITTKWNLYSYQSLFLERIKDLIKSQDIMNPFQRKIFHQKRIFNILKKIEHSSYKLFFLSNSPSFLTSLFLPWLLFFLYYDFLNDYKELLDPKPYHFSLFIFFTLELGLSFSSMMNNCLDFYIKIFSLKRLNISNDCKSNKKNEKTPCLILSNNNLLLSCHNIYAKYSGSQHQVLKNINLQINLADKIAICGPSGSGKTSLLNSLLQLLHVESGKFRLNYPLWTDTKPENIRKLFFVIPQNPSLFVGTIRENLDYDRSYSDEKVWSTLNFFNLDKILLLKGGLDHSFDKDNNLFNESETFLFFLAKALLSKKPIFLIDEIGKNISFTINKKIKFLFKNFFKNKTVIIVSHDRETINLCNLRIEMKNGYLYKN